MLRYLKQWNLVGANEYGEFRMDLVREQGRWILRDEHHQDFRELRMTATDRGISEVTPVNARVSPLLKSWLNEGLAPAGQQGGQQFGGRFARVKEFGNPISVAGVESSSSAVGSGSRSAL